MILGIFVIGIGLGFALAHMAAALKISDLETRNALLENRLFSDWRARADERMANREGR